jgi:hypothetical protein
LLSERNCDKVQKGGDFIMTADREFMYWRSNKEWYRINENGCFELTDKATDRAKKSYELYKQVQKNNRYH